ncbi:HK97 family phage prohead protease [Desulfonema magnum]|uniref:Peptidase domain-containing protein n=1 Tax=Desulfonema magnum TaxID=45655 RepID=A0A975BLU8_9BACT|nr:HK97 family phage prohead protease [Desulfonema magnum]QTA87937.1 Peptidase domain-containing protein [Desulfonema magnum]
MNEPLLTTRRLDTPVTPASFDDKTRSVKVIAATERPILRHDPEYDIFINMISLVSGVRLPPSGQVPLLDSHNWTSVSSVLGSVRNFEVRDQMLVCDVFFSGTADGREAAQKVREGHLTDFSVSFEWVLKDSYVIPEGKTENVNGQTVPGPTRIIKVWYLLELSITPIGANEDAKPVFSPEPQQERRQIADILFFTFTAYILIFFLLKAIF